MDSPGINDDPMLPHRLERLSQLISQLREEREAPHATASAYQAVALELGKSYEALQKENGRLKQDLAQLEPRLTRAEAQRDGLRIELKERDGLIAELRPQIKRLKLALARLLANWRQRRTPHGGISALQCIEELEDALRNQGQL